MKVGNWVLFWLHKSYLIPVVVEMIKKLTQKYVGLFLIKEKVGRLVYKFNIPPD